MKPCSRWRPTNGRHDLTHGSSSLLREEAPACSTASPSPLPRRGLQFVRRAGLAAGSAELMCVAFQRAAGGSHQLAGRPACASRWSPLAPRGLGEPWALLEPPLGGGWRSRALSLPSEGRLNTRGKHLFLKRYGGR